MDMFKFRQCAEVMKIKPQKNFTAENFRQKFFYGTVTYTTIAKQYNIQSTVQTYSHSPNILQYPSCLLASFRHHFLLMFQCKGVGVYSWKLMTFYN